MAKNHVQEGSVLTLIAPAGGVVSGTAYAIGQLVAVALEDAAEGLPFEGAVAEVWRLPCAAGLTAGAKVSLLDNALVADGTASSVPCGKLATAEAGGFASVRLSN